MEQTPDTKQALISRKPHSLTVEVFTEVAPKYEFLNSLMTAGMDRRWRLTMLNLCEAALGYKPQNILDLATGTGDVARMMAEKWPGAKIQGTDPTKAMLDLARGRSSLEKSHGSYRMIQWREGVAESIEAEDGSLDLITIAFGFRNVAEGVRQKAVEEAYRALRPGGVFAILELGLPRAKILRAPYKLLLKEAMPRFAGLFSPKGPYDYLARSIAEFPPPDQVKKLIGRCGFLAFAPRPLSTGMCWLYLGKKQKLES